LRRKELGGYVPKRSVRSKPLVADHEELFHEFYTGSEGREVSTTMAFVSMLRKMLRDPEIGKLIVPIVPDEARTFGMESLFRNFGIYSSRGQLYEPVDIHTLLYYKEAKDGQILEEGITEAGSMSSFIAAGSAYATHGINTIPFFIYYSMFGLQRIGDLIWAAADMRCRGFLLGGTAGRTTLAGEGLQHQDGHSQLVATTIPNCRAYDPAYAYELAVIIHDGMRRMYADNEGIFYYISVMNENYAQPALPAGAEAGIIKGGYLFKTGGRGKVRATLLGSGTILRECLAAADILQRDFGIPADIYSITSFSELRREALECERWNLLHPGSPPRSPYVHSLLGERDGPIVAATDYVRNVPDQIRPWLHQPYVTLGTDGFGRSDARAELRRFFEVDRNFITLAALKALADTDRIDRKTVVAAVQKLGIDPEKADPLKA